MRVLSVYDAMSVEVRNPAGMVLRTFGMDAAFGEQAATSDVFAATRGLVSQVLRGGCAAVLAYGPTGSGKTYTMYGTASDPGLVPRVAAELLHASGGQPVRASVVELHNESLTDLLAPREKGLPAAPLEVRGGSGGEMVTIEGAQEVFATNELVLFAAIRGALARRHVSATMVNAASSRSHVLVLLSVGSGRVMLADLAGLERVKRSGSEGNALREAQCINRSLQSLSDVVEALRHGSSHVPRRNTRLARIVSGALGGSVETMVLVCISPEVETYDEALCALCFADRVRRIPAAGIAVPVPRATPAP